MDYKLIGSIIIPIAIPSIIRYMSKTNEQKKWSASLGPTIGATFTFGGICIGLHDFDANNINESLPILLDGLKTAFYSSLAGMGTGLIINFVNKIKIKEANLDLKDLLIDLIEEIQNNTKQQSEDNAKLILSINTNSQYQFQLNSRLDTFLKDVSENSSKEIIEALQKVMESFNEKINDRLTDAINNLTDITNNVVKYQTIEISQREKTIERLNMFNELIAQIKFDMEQIQIASLESSKQWMLAAESSNNINQKSKELSDVFSHLCQLSKDAKEASINMSKLFDDWDKGITEVNKHHIQTLAQHCESIMRHMKNILDKQIAA